MNLFFLPADSKSCNFGFQKLIRANWVKVMPMIFTLFPNMILFTFLNLSVKNKIKVLLRAHTTFGSHFLAKQ